MNPMRTLTLALIGALVGLAAPAGAVTLLGFDTARPTAPQHIEAGAGVVALDGAYGLFAQGRIGLLPELEGRLAAGVILLDEDFGFEVDIGGKFRLLPAEAAVVDVAVGAQVAFTKTVDVFLGGIDPMAYASRHFALPGDRELFVGLGVGAALTFVDFNGPADDTTFGFVGGLTAGVDIIEDLAFALETRWRDGVWRLGGMVALDF